jgi:hypothetical protein
VLNGDVVHAAGELAEEANGVLNGDVVHAAGELAEEADGVLNGDVVHAAGELAEEADGVLNGDVVHAAGELTEEAKGVMNGNARVCQQGSGMVTYLLRGSPKKPWMAQLYVPMVCLMTLTVMNEGV